MRDQREYKPLARSEGAFAQRLRIATAPAAPVTRSVSVLFPLLRCLTSKTNLFMNNMFVQQENRCRPSTSMKLVVKPLCRGGTTEGNLID